MCGRRGGDSSGGGEETCLTGGGSRVPSVPAAGHFSQAGGGPSHRRGQGVAVQKPRLDGEVLHLGEVTRQAASGNHQAESGDHTRHTS